jgi:geranylgeranyl diphosphate synthase type I
VDAELERWMGVASNLRHFADMMRYQLEFVDEHGSPLTTSSSKRFRPLLCLLACQGAGADPARAMTVAAAIELLHNFSLIHDDIQDRDETRRHRPTVWKLWGGTGYKRGDGMFALASRASVDASEDPVIGLDVARRFQCTTLLLTEGQYLDMSFEQRTDVDAQEYLDMIARKTGALIEFSLWSGARVAGADDVALEAFGNFGLELGKAFQIYDDIQGVWGDTTTTGKEAAKDLSNRKRRCRCCSPRSTPPRAVRHPPPLLPPRDVRPGVGPTGAGRYRQLYQDAGSAPGASDGRSCCSTRRSHGDPAA